MPFDSLEHAIDGYDVIVFCAKVETNFLDHMDRPPQLILDLSVPSTQTREYASAKGVEYLDLDSTSRLIDHTLNRRRQSLPKAKKIISKHIEAFNSWYNVYKQREKILSAKEFIESKVQAWPFENGLSDQQKYMAVKKVVNEYVKNLKTNVDVLPDVDLLIENYMSKNN
ncbi:MAG: hypothetical protein IH946_08775 [Bacteroidetes bacterium]|nr:hypothetical protein [Bacteroidota bacterium]